MAVPMASLQRAATNPLARRAGVAEPVDPYAALKRPPAPAPPVDLSGSARRNAENDAATAEANRRARDANAPQPAGYGVPSSVPRGTSSMPSQPAAQPFNPYAEQDAKRAEENARMAEFQRQRAIQLKRDEDAAAAEQQRQRDESDAFIQQQNADRQRKTDEDLAYRESLTRTPETGAVGRNEGTLDAGAEREDLSALIDMARQKGMLGPATSSSQSTAMSSLANAAAPAPVARVATSDGGAASRASFSTAKDRVGQLGRGAMNSLTRAMSGRGLSGSSIEGNAMGSLVEESQGELADNIRDQAGYDAARGDAEADRNYSGDITQRGQDIAAQEEAARLGLATRSQTQSETNAGYSNLQGLMSLVRRGRPAY